MSENYVDENGLHVQSRAEIVKELEDAFKEIYGADIALTANSPDKQMIEIFAQAKIDMLELAADVYNSFDLTTAVGRVLDARVALNGVVRRSATYTKTMVDVTFDRTTTLNGVDTSTTPFTISDEAGTKFVLEATTTETSGTSSLSFRAENEGQVAAIQDTLTTIVTVTLGVTAVNNPGAAYQDGVEEETDADLRVRRRASVALPSEGFLEGLQGALLAISGVTNCVVYENNTSTTDGFGVPAHSIWAIVNGGSDADISDVIYRKRNAGCGMKGDEVVAVMQVNGTEMEVRFDRPLDEDLYLDFTITSIDPLHTIDDQTLIDQIYAGLTYGIYDPADSSAAIALIKELDPLAVITDAQASADGNNWDAFIYPSTIQSRWVLDPARITITVI